MSIPATTVLTRPVPETAAYFAGYRCPHCPGAPVLIVSGIVTPAHTIRCPRHPVNRTAARAAGKAVAA